MAACVLNDQPIGRTGGVVATSVKLHATLPDLQSPSLPNTLLQL
jgi:hypothetical protein